MWWPVGKLNVDLFTLGQRFTRYTLPDGIRQMQVKSQTLVQLHAFLYLRLNGRHISKYKQVDPKATLSEHMWFTKEERMVAIL